MRAKVNFKKRAKNSLIYFQLGLIATMVVVLFVLELQFLNVKKSMAANHVPLHVEDVFVYNPVVLRSDVIKPVVAKPAVKLPKIVDGIEVAENDEKVVKKEVLANESVSEVNNTVEETITGAPTDNGNTSKSSEPTIISVEQLPMFKACKGLSRAEQKACFDAELAKVVSRYLVYPESDYENGKQGIALVEFTIDENGKVVNVKSLDNKRATPEMQKAAEKAIKRIPQLIPAKQGGNNVKIKYSLPIRFKLQ
jgi:TonB family protein